MITLTPDQEKAILAEATAQLVQHLISKGNTAILLTPAQAGGILDVSPATLMQMHIPRIDLSGNGKAFRYRLSDVMAMLAEREAA